MGNPFWAVFIYEWNLISFDQKEMHFFNPTKTPFARGARVYYVEYIEYINLSYSTDS